MTTTEILKVDFDLIVSVVVTCFFVLLFFIGFHTGSQNGHR